MDAKATAKYLERRISDAVKEAEGVRKDFAELMAIPLNIGSRSTSSHVLDALINAEAVAVAFLEIRSVAKGTLEQVGPDAFLDAVRKERDNITRWLRTSRLENSGIVEVQEIARHNAATKVLSATDVIEIIDEIEDPEQKKAAKSLAWLRNGWDGDNSARAITAFDALEKAGVFKEIDAQWGDVAAGEKHLRETEEN